MPQLTAVGAEPSQRRQVDIAAQRTLRLGRAPGSGWDIPWEPRLSREHADLICRDGQLFVRVLETARNGCIVDGLSTRDFVIEPGQEFRVGETRFYFAAGVPNLTQTVGTAVLEQAYDRDDLRRFRFDDANERLELLAGLPRLIAESHSDVDLAARLVDLLIEAIAQADAAAVVVMPVGAPRGDAAGPGTAEGDTLTGEANPVVAASLEPTTMRWTCRREGGQFSPSRQLIAAALARGQSLLHVWEGGEAVQFTRSADLDWAFCTPIGGEACRGWVLYVSGQFQLATIASGKSVESLKGHVRFAELLAQFISAIRQVRRLEQRHTAMSRFFSPTVASRIVDPNFEAQLDPKEGPITVLFCDLRGFSQQAERSGSQLRAFLARVSAALGVMTRSVLGEQGVIADFQGDAVLAFWGWPTPLAAGPLAACRAALAIRERFAAAAAEKDSLLAGFDVGIGIAHGPAIAGRLGTDEQIKVGVFGPVVNLASRLQSLAHQVGVTIVIDPTTSDFVQSSLPRTVGRQRSLARLRPKGLAIGVLVSELLPPEGPLTLTDAQLDAHDALVAAFISGDWETARRLAAAAESVDGARQFLLDFMTEHDFLPPAGWDGVISLKEK